jgi:hypothetical protein
MPYIKKERRDDIVSHIDIDTILGFERIICCGEIQTSGELNFAITKLIIEYIKDKELCYDELNTIMGVIECVKQEFYRRVVAPYEETKIKENGDVY